MKMVDRSIFLRTMSVLDDHDIFRALDLGEVRSGPHPFVRKERLEKVVSCHQSLMWAHVS